MRLEGFVIDEAAAAVVAVDGHDEIGAAVPVAAGVDEASVSSQTNRVQVAVRIDEGHACNLVRGNAVKEPIAGTWVDGPLGRDERS